MSSEEYRQAMASGGAAEEPREALPHFRAALALVPGDPAASSAAGLALLQLGRLSDAEPLLRAAVTAQPDETAYRLNWTQWLLARGRHDAAIAELQAVLARAPQNLSAWEMTGDIAAAQQKFEAASRAYAHVLSQGRTRPGTAMKQARVLAAAGQWQAALDAIRIAHQSPAADESVFALHTDILQAQGRWRDAAELAEAWMQAFPSSINALRALAAAAFELGEFRRSAEASARLVELVPGDAEILAGHGQLCLQIGDYDAAAAAFDAAEAAAPNLPQMLSGKARLLTFLGEFDAAEEYCRRALKRDPNRIEAYWTLTLLKAGVLRAADITALQRLVRDTALWPDSRAMAAFALGQSLEAKGDAAAAFSAYDTAHTLKRDKARRDGSAYDAAASEAHFASLIRAFGEPRPALESNATRPIFVFGMPRSGTTLVYAMLGAHSGVRGCGENPRMHQLLGAFLARWRASGERWPDADTLAGLARDYLEVVSIPGGRSLDKYLLNLESAGLIAALFPGATMIHTRRNPLETGLSIWRHEFPGTLRFVNRLEDIGHYYGQYAKLMAHWQRVLGPRFITVQYEDLATRFGEIAPELVAACGLNWEDACLARETIGQPIETMSTVQVRKPVVPAALRAERFAAQLAPLRTALERGGVDLQTGEWRGA